MHNLYNFQAFVVGAQDKTWERRLSSVFRADGIRRIPLTASSWGQKGSPSISGLGRTRCLQWKRLSVNSCSAAPIGLVPLCACAVSFSLRDHRQMNPCAARSFLGGEVAHSRYPGGAKCASVHSWRRCMLVLQRIMDKCLPPLLCWLASGSGSFDAAGNLMVTAEHVQAQLAGLRLFSVWCAGLVIAQCFHFRWPVGWSSSTFRFGALSAAPCHLLGRGQLMATVTQSALPSQCTVLVPLPLLLLPSHVQPFTRRCFGGGFDV